MDWLPSTIDAFGRLYEHTGPFGFACFLFFAFAMFVTWRHSTAIVQSFQMLVQAKAEANAEAKIATAELKKQTATLVNLEGLNKTQAEALKKMQPAIEKVARWPTDLPCMAKPAGS